ncbi:unnamed protein product [Merluccius merluccius]
MDPYPAMLDIVDLGTLDRSMLSFKEITESTGPSASTPQVAYSVRGSSSSEEEQEDQKLHHLGPPPSTGPEVDNTDTVGNMFQEGLYQVYRRETQNDLPPPVTTNQGDLRDARMQRWFGTVVGSRVLVTGRIGSHVAKGSSITFTVLCLLASLYTLFLSWRGIRRYSTPNSQTYSPVAQHFENGTSPLLEVEELNL